MQIVSLRSAFRPSPGGPSDGRCQGDGGAAVHSKLPCEDAALLCSLPRSQTKPPSAVSVCRSLSPARSTTAAAPEKSPIFPIGELVV